MQPTDPFSARYQDLLDALQQACERLFGRKRRPYSRQGKASRFEVERPTYDLIVFKVPCGLLTSWVLVTSKNYEVAQQSCNTNSSQIPQLPAF
jgi:hypothetical protein